MKSIPNTFSSVLLLCLVTLQVCWCSQASVEICSAFSCNPTEQDTIMFPFHVPRNQSNRCGYPGFDLTCGRNGQTFLNLSSKPLRVRYISYTDQFLLVSDPAGSCIPNRVLNMNLTSTPFSYGQGVTPSYSFLNCSRTKITNVDTSQFRGTSVVTCLSGDDYIVLTTFEKESEDKLVDNMKCKVIKRVNAAFWRTEMDNEGYFPVDMSDVLLQLSWDVPNCGDCVANGGVCSFANHSGLAVACFFPPDSGGLPRSAKYGLVLGAGIPAILCMIGLTYYISSRARARNQNRSPNMESSPAIFPQPMMLTVGLDRPTIESYPKIILGESKRLPKTNDGTCPICLSEYLPKETLRSLPECNHFFHADCIDEWLRMNATCPLCRNSPQ